MPKKNIARVFIVTGLVLAAAAIANHFSVDFNWSPFDFVFIGVLLAGAGLTFEFVASMGNNASYKAAAGLAVLASLMLIWVNGAVGIIGSEDNPANAMYLGVLVIGMFGALMSRLQPTGMARTLFTMGFLTAVIPLIAYAINPHQFAEHEKAVGFVGILFLNMVFVLMFVGSGILFRQTAESNSNRQIS